MMNQTTTDETFTYKSTSEESQKDIETEAQLHEEITVTKTEIKEEVCDFQELNNMEFVDVKEERPCEYFSLTGDEVEKKFTNPTLCIELSSENSGTETEVPYVLIKDDESNAENESKMEVSRKKFKGKKCQVDHSQGENSKITIQKVNCEEEGKVLKCTACYIGFSNQTLLVNHSRMCPNKADLNSNKETFVCSFCKIRLFDEKYYEKHLKGCERKYLRKNQKQDVVDERRKTFKCDLCSFGGTKKYLLQQHMLIHNNDRQFKCSICDRSFNQKRHLARHIKLHDDRVEQKMMCPHCKSTYVNLSSLNYHIKAKHLNVKEYKCTECTYAAVRKDSLKNHMFVKHGDSVKKFRCDHCEYSTHQKPNLMSHVRIHTNTKPYKCTYEGCNYESATPGTLKRHIKHCHTFEKAFKCEKCDYECVQKVTLTLHIRRVHKEHPL